MILIICENILATKTVALSLGANTEAANGIYTSDTVTVASIPPRFIRQTPLRELAGGEYPFMPDKFRMSVTMKELERQLKPLFRAAVEVVFASDGGADAQARFFNICRHFRVGCPIAECGSRASATAPYAEPSTSASPGDTCTASHRPALCRKAWT